MREGAYVFFDGLDREGIVDSVLASPFESGVEFLYAVGCVPTCGSKEPRKGTIESQTVAICSSRLSHLKKHSYV